MELKIIFYGGRLIIEIVRVQEGELANNRHKLFNKHLVCMRQIWGQDKPTARKLNSPP